MRPLRPSQIPDNPMPEMTMHFDRRAILKAGAALALAAELPARARADVTFDPKPGTWRTYQVVTRLAIEVPNGVTQAWIPLPSVSQKAWIEAQGSTWTGNGTATLVRDPHYGAEMLHVAWSANEG